MQYETLDSLCKVASGGTPSRSKKEYWEDGNIPWIKIGNIKNKYVSEADEYITEAGLNNSSAKLFPKGTILYTIFATLGEVGILTIDACTNQAIAGITIEKTDLITTDYLYYYLKSKKAEVNQIGRGVAQNNINLSILKKFSVPLRGKKEQEKIVETLKHIEIAIENKKLELANLDNLTKARFVEMFDNDQADKVPISDLVEKRIATAKKDFGPDDIIKYIDISSIDNKRNMMTGYTEYKMSNAPSRAQQHVCTDDILISTVRPNLKNIAIVSCRDNNIVASSGFCVLRAKKCTPAYLMAVVCSDNFTDSMVQAVTGANYPAIKNSDVLSYLVPLPNEQQQKAFSNFVAQVDKSKFALCNELAVCDFYVRLIHDRVMHGRIDLGVS